MKKIHDYLTLPFIRGIVIITNLTSSADEVIQGAENPE